MKKLIFATLVALSLSLATPPLFAADTEKASVSQADAVAVQKGVQELSQLFNVEQPKKEESKKTEVSNTEKTVAQVMDKAIDKVSDVVGVMAQTINKIAPDVWKIMLRQQYAKAVMACVVPVGLLMVLILHMKLVGKYWRPDDQDGDEVQARRILVRIIPTIMTFFAGLWFFNRLSDSIALLINPEFYAIQDLLRMILNRGM